jgi:hypothetical protein
MRPPSRTNFLFLLVLLVLSIPLSSQANDSRTAMFTGKVIGASDGNTISVMHEGRAYGGEIPPVWCTRIEGEVYSMISFPYIPEDRDVLGQLVNDLGPYDPTEWRLFRYDPALSTYIECPETFDFGWGYWIISRNTAEICVEGEPPEKNGIILSHEGDGWNQIGNIYDYDFPIVSLYVARVSSPFGQNQLIDPATNGLTYVTLQKYEDGSYVDIPNNGENTLEAGKGYWLRVRQDVGENVVLWFLAGESSAQPGEIYLSEEFFERVAQQDTPPDPPVGLENPSSASSSGGSVSCFFSTSIYRDRDHPHVQVLREFRDQYLSANGIGRILVIMYYRWSPAIASFVAQWKPFDTLVRFTLLSIISFAVLVSKTCTYGFLMLCGLPFVGSFFLLKRGILRRLKRERGETAKELSAGRIVQV